MNLELARLNEALDHPFCLNRPSCDSADSAGWEVMKHRDSAQMAAIEAMQEAATAESLLQQAKRMTQPEIMRRVGKYEVERTIGILNFKFEDFDAAVEDLSTCVQSDRDYNSTYTCLGLALSSIGEYTKAVEAHKKSLQLGRNSLKALLQIDPQKYKSISSGFGFLLREQGVKGFYRGCVPTLFDVLQTSCPAFSSCKEKDLNLNVADTNKD
ncbi:hypothetical protein RIF29_42039 [Crotalaria pallida]|uniref:DUF6857 domain-containing protein n=1 Tax=Crotalaria pallida TaxID=3830 RepID=A0AAN9EC74_CROPI